MGALMPSESLVVSDKTRIWSSKEHKLFPKTKSNSAVPVHTRSEVRRKRGRCNVQLCSLGARGGGAKIDSSTLVQRSQEPPQLLFIESGGAMRTRNRPRRKPLCSLAARGGGVELATPRSFSTPASKSRCGCESARMALISIGHCFRGRLLNG
jgi:hypothetical protein